MLFLIFQLGEDRYALDTSDVVEVLPLLEVKSLPKAPAAVLGLFAYRSRTLPLIDLTALALGRPSRARTSTRIIVARVRDGAAEPRLIGLCAERATETMRCAESDFVAPPVTVRDAPYLGPVISDDRGIVQRVSVDRLLPADVLRVLVGEGAEAGA
ncbi:MAG: purine-binding chemotaxis protein CheW [Polyangiaceae bacterium]|nr:purine-binding chemotaxis protein CheW [Polyangiaceae bacterium]